MFIKVSYKLKTFINAFLSSEQIGGILLLITLSITLIIANSSFRNYLYIINNQIFISHNLLFWVNDGLMSIFFLLAGLEIKREVLYGELNSIKKASLPILAALGGILFPALIFAFINSNSPLIKGWGIPTATDIALAISMVMLLGKRIPYVLKIFLLALAIVDDLGAILLIAFVYNVEINFVYLTLSVSVFVLLFILNILEVKKIIVYILLGIILWYFLHLSGVHATLSGVMLAFCMPNHQIKNIEHHLYKPVNYIIMPLFAFFNASIVIDYHSFTAINSALGWGVILGLLIGKPLGITLFSFIATKFKIAHLPQGCSWVDIFGIGLFGGIGFTMSIFVAMLSLPLAHQDTAKFAILLASIGASIIGCLFFIIKSIFKNAI